MLKIQKRISALMLAISLGATLFFGHTFSATASETTPQDSAAAQNESALQTQNAAPAESLWGEDV